jgi:hypothetical protein
MALACHFTLMVPRCFAVVPNDLADPLSGAFKIVRGSGCISSATCGVRCPASQGSQDHPAYATSSSGGSYPLADRYSQVLRSPRWAAG